MSQIIATPAKVGGRLIATYWREAAPVGLVVVALALLQHQTGPVVTALVAGGVGGVALAVPLIRRRVAGWWRCARTRRLMRSGLAAIRMANNRGQLPRVRRVVSTPVGERAYLRTRPGHSAELLQIRMEELRAAVKAHTVRIERDPTASHRITVDVVRRDPLASTPEVAWLDHGTAQLSLWEPLHIGLTEFGEALRLPLIYRGLLTGGLMDTGKSSLLSLVVSHAARSESELYLIDPQGVQFGPWRDRATAYASQDPDEALEVLEMVRAEIDRRLALLETLPGVVRKVTPQIAADHGLHPMLLGIDELAYHTATVGTSGQQQRFVSAGRDVVSRGRAVGLIPVMATQRPTQDVVPRSLADLFGVRVAFRVANSSNSDVILGDGHASRGYDASDIGLTARGVGLIVSGGTKPQKIKVPWVSDNVIADLSLTTLGMRPRRRTSDLPTTA